MSNCGSKKFCKKKLSKVDDKSKPIVMTTGKEGWLSVVKTSASCFYGLPASQHISDGSTRGQKRDSVTSSTYGEFCCFFCVPDTIGQLLSATERDEHVYSPLERAINAMSCLLRNCAFYTETSTQVHRKSMTNVWTSLSHRLDHDVT